MNDTNPYLLHAAHLQEAASHADPGLWILLMKIAAAQNTTLDENREARIVQVQQWLENAIQTAPEAQQADLQHLRQTLESTWQEIRQADQALDTAQEAAAEHREAIENIHAEETAYMEEMKTARNNLKNQVYQREAEAASLIQAASEEAARIYHPPAQN